MGFLSRTKERLAESPQRTQSPILTTIQTILRFLELAAAIAVLAIYSYTLGALSNRGLDTPTDVRAVEGIVGVTIAYILICLLLLRVSRTRTFPAFVLILLDVAFGAAWIYVATANGGGTSCSGEVNTHFGKGKAGDGVKGKKDGFMSLPSYGDACRLLTACLAIAILTIFMFIGSIVTTLFLGRDHYAEKRKIISADSLDEQTSYPPLDSPKPGHDDAPKKFSFKNLFGRRAREQDPDSTLPTHVQPSDMSLRRQSLRPDQQYSYVNEHPAAAESDIALAGGRRGYQPVPEDGRASPETVYTEYDPHRRQTPPPPVVSHQLRENPYSPTTAHPQQDNAYSQAVTHQRHEEPYSQADVWRPVDITGGSQLNDAASARFPMAPYQNLNSNSMRNGYQGVGRGRAQGYQYGDGVYDA